MKELRKRFDELFGDKSVQTYMKFEAVELLEMAEYVGYMWAAGQRLSDYNFWEDHLWETHYNFFHNENVVRYNEHKLLEDYVIYNDGDNDYEILKLYNDIQEHKKRLDVLRYIMQPYIDWFTENYSKYQRFVLGVRLCDEKEIENSITFNEKLGRTTLVLDGRVIRANLQKGDVWNEKIGLLITLLKFNSVSREEILFGYKRYKTPKRVEIYLETLLVNNNHKLGMSKNQLIKLLDNFDKKDEMLFVIKGVEKTIKINRK